MQEARKIIEQKIPEGRPQMVFPFENLFVFMIFGEEGSIESQMDPYYSVDRKTKEVKEFSMIENNPLKVMEVIANEAIELVGKEGD